MIPASEEYQAALKLLPAMSREELEKLRGRCSALLHLTPEGSGLAHIPQTGEGIVEGDDCTLVLGCLAEVLQGRGVEFVAPSLLRKHAGFGNFKAKVPGVVRFLKTASKERRIQRAILCVGFQFLYDNLRGQGIPVSGVTVMKHVHRVPSLINFSFPGYAEAGMLDKIIRTDEEN